MADILFLVLIILLPVICGVLFSAGAVRYQKNARSVWNSRPLLSLYFCLFFLSTIFLGFEIYYRYFYDTTDSFGLTRVTEKWFLRYHKTNSFGARDNREYNFYPPGDRPRITFLGDSFTTGHGVPNVDDRFANRVRNQMNGKSEVQVFAQNGWDTGKEYDFIQLAALNKYPFGNVTLIYCIHDISDLDPGWRKILRRIYDEHGTEPWLFQKSFYLNLLYYRWKGSRDPDIANYYGFVLKSYDGPLWEAQKERLVQLKNLVQEAGGTFSVVTFPVLNALKEEYEYQSVHEKINEFWKEQNVPHLDLLPVYRKYRPEQLTLNPYDAHPNAFAHDLAAKAIVNFYGQCNCLPSVVMKNHGKDAGPMKPFLPPRGFFAIKVQEQLVYSREANEDFLSLYLGNDFPEKVTAIDLERLELTRKMLEPEPSTPAWNFRKGMNYFFLALARTKRLTEGEVDDASLTSQYWHSSLSYLRKAGDLETWLAEEIESWIREADKNRDQTLDNNELKSIFKSHPPKPI